MLLLRPNSSLPDLDASPLHLRSLSYPSYNTIPSKQFTSSPSEEVLSNYVHTTLPSQHPYSMYSSSQDQRDESLVDSWLPPSAGAGAPADVPHPADASSALVAQSAVSRSTYSPPHPVSAGTPLNDPARHARLLHTPGGSPSPRHQSFPSQQHPVSLNRHVSEPNIRSVAAQPATHYPLSNVTEARYQQQPRRQPHRQSFVGPLIHSPSSGSFSAERRPSTAGSAASSGWDPRELHGVTAVTPTQGAHASLLWDPRRSL
jgi:hypothetical protein